MKRTRYIKMMAIITFVISLMSGCALIGGPELPGGGGGIDLQPRYINGRYRSEQGRVIEFSSTTRKYKLYTAKEEFQNNNPSIIAKYKILGKQIIFYKESGEEFEDRGILNDDDTQFTWDEYPGETFVRENN